MGNNSQSDLGVDTSRLTSRERELARLIALGQTNEQISASMRMDGHAISAEIDDLAPKLGLRTRVQIAVWALRHTSGFDSVDCTSDKSSN